MEISDWLERNRANWDERVSVHAGSDFYDLPAFRVGADTLRPFEVDEVGDVTDLRLLHLQCHMGQDTLSWARRGAQVTGLDFSLPAITTARSLAREVGLADRSRFVVGDVYSAAEALQGHRYDLVYTGLGALVWLPDLTRWATMVAALLVDGGRLYLTEFHPLTDALAEDGRTIEHDYFDPHPHLYDTPFTYTDGPALTRTTSVQWQHPLGEVITAVAEAGLRIEFCRERATTLFRRYPGLERGDAGEYRFPAPAAQIPLTYSLRALKI